jgi:hypothetical protein
MSIIKRKIENLKPGKEYLLTVRAKNADINVISDYTDSIRFVVPTDSTIPGQIADFNLAANFEKVMFSFTDLSDKDIRKYEYELYDNGSMTGTPISGFAYSNLFTVSVDNSTDSATKTYYGRVRAIDSSNNSGDWSILVSSGSTPLITEEYIDSLTASKITAGTIGAQTITLNGSSSIIRSSNFDGDQGATPQYGDATQGWLIEGSGKAYFYEATVVGGIIADAIDIGGNDSTSFHVDIDGDLWLGDATFDDAKFRVSSNGEVRAGEIRTLSIVGVSPNTPSGYVEYSTAAAHGLEVDDAVLISGLAPSSYNGSFIVTSAPTASTFRVENSATTTVTDSSGSALTTALFIDTDGSMTIGFNKDTGNFKISRSGKLDIGGTDVSSFHINQYGRVWSGAASWSDAKFRISGDGVVRIGSTASALYINNDGSMNIGSSLGTGQFKITATGQLDVGGTDSNSFHVQNDGTVWVGSTTYNTITSPFVIYKDGSLHIGGQDGTSFHILKNGNIIAGAKKESTITDWSATVTNAARTGGGTTVTITTTNAHGLAIGDTVSTTNIVSSPANAFNFTDKVITAKTTYTFTVEVSTTAGTTYTSGGSYRRAAPFSLESSSGKLRVSYIDVSGTLYGTGESKNLYGVLFINDKVARANHKTYGTDDSDSYDQGNNYVFNAGDGLIFRDGTTNKAVVNSSGMQSVAYAAISSERYKTDIRLISDSVLDPRKLLDIPVIQFRYKDDSLNSEYPIPGLLAEDVFNKYPAACYLSSDGTIQGWNLNAMVAPLLKLVQDLYKKVEDLELKLLK